MILLEQQPVATQPMPISASVAPPAKSPSKLKAVVREILGWILSAFGAFALGCQHCFQLPLSEAIFNFLFSYTIFVLLWKGNGLLTNTLSLFYPWVRNPSKRFIISLIATLLLTVVVVILVNIVFLTYKGYTLQDLSQRNWASSVGVPVIITFIISLFFHSWHFLQGWRQTAINAERLEKENIASQYESLKAQVNPHFLFNSLNVLTSLVETDQKQAVRFIRKLSEVYRYVLDSRQKEIVPLLEELHFLESYIYLQKIRHGEALQVQNDIPLDASLMVVPLALQMLIENAIKHNMALEEEPLQVHLYIENDYLVVQNNLQERRIREESTGMGLPNIESRYSYLTNNKVQIIATSQEFTVKLPLLYFKG
ncbi:sensor histidine kinase [Pontibacter sp. SGAir0037]|uniref:sensor histidine kinase n=1 Tax=Pontibacter sp. SGAir0037 TaxID=2571030 RepID=UPI0010CD6230|nr:sensor histidine kinase [Pontibacter sp. SGAir0037]QCR24133.1 histidine kinase [Pontibacter sp. SGAir0037]